METMLQYMTSITNQYAEIAEQIATGSVAWSEIPSLISVFFNMFPFIPIIFIAVITFAACWSYKLFKPCCAVLGAGIFGVLGFSLLTIFPSISPVIGEVISLAGCISLACAALGALLFYFCARFFISLSFGVSAFGLIATLIDKVDVSAMAAGYKPSIAALIVGILVGLLIFLVIFIFFKKIYLFITCILGMTVAGFLAGLTVSSSLKVWYVSWISGGIFALIGLFIGIAIFSRHLRDNNKVKY